MIAAPSRQQKMLAEAFALKISRSAVAGVLRNYLPDRSASSRAGLSSRIAALLGYAALGFAFHAAAAPVSVNLPAQPLTDSLTQLAKKAGVSVVFDSTLVAGKTAPALSGAWEPDEAFRRLLRGSGLQITMEGDTALIRRQVPGTKNETIKTDVVDVRASRFKQVGPMPGLNLTKEEIPGNVQSISAKEIAESKAVTMAELLNSRLQSVNVNDYQGNPFQMDVSYRGFTASPQIGTPQGLSVFMDGIRVNEPFGDIVNWDLIPMNALAGIDVFPGSNPIFGLNTLGGAIAVRTKNGFDDPGTTADALTGSWGRKQVMFSTGGNNGAVGGFLAFNRFQEDGWRSNSPSRVMQVFGKASYRTDNLDLHGSMTYVENNLIGNGLIPIEMYKNDPESVFTSPDQTRNKLVQFQVASAFQVNDTMSITGQVYRRKSDRHAITGDVNREFADYGGVATRRPTATESPVCAYSSTNSYGIPDYYVASEGFGDGSGLGLSSVAISVINGVYSSLADAMVTDGDGDGNVDIDPSTFNQALPPEALEMITAGTRIESGMFNGSNGPIPGNAYISTTPNGYGNPSVVYDSTSTATWYNTVTSSSYYWMDANDSTITHYLVFAEPLNGTCGTDSINSSTALLDSTRFSESQIQVLDSSGNTIRRNGAFSNGLGSSGYIEGTPNAIITNIDINQIVKGGSAQLNWDTGRHKFMVGGSLDHATNNFTSWQMLGLLSASREAYLAPDEVGEEFSAATVPVYNNILEGSSKTRSLYFSETFNPTDALHFSASARYNHTRVMTNMRVRHYTDTVDLMNYQSSYMSYLLCAGAGLDACDSYLLDNPLLNSDLTSGQYLDPYEKEVASYHKLNPSFGMSWSPREHLNLYTNWNQGTRTPSAIELGCAFDNTPVKSGSDSNGNPVYTPASIYYKRACTLPTALSGDPYLPQVVARTLEFGARGKLVNGWDWNASIYRTNLQDDIYFVSYTSTMSFFDTIGKTRRQGLEMGVGGKEGRFDFKANYSLTDATFQATAKVANADNSSVSHFPQTTDYDLMTISPGDRMPGVPLHNLNLNLGYQITDKWRLGLTMVAHSSSYARGNENNKHRGGAEQSYLRTDDGGSTYYTLTRRFIGDGKTAGYAVFNLSTSYDFGGGWVANLTINNLLDKEYYSASRLDINPFSPSINGVVGESGFNYNSNDWNSTSFVAPGAPRAAWLTVKYDFGADKR